MVPQGCRAGERASANRSAGVYVAGLGVPRDDTEAVNGLHKAAEQGEAAAQTALGLEYAEGRGVPRE